MLKNFFECCNFLELRKIAGGIMDRAEKSNATAVVTKEKKESRRKSTTSNEASNKNDKKE